MTVDIELGLFSWYGFAAPLAHCLQQLGQAGFASGMIWRGEDTLPYLDEDEYPSWR